MVIKNSERFLSLKRVFIKVHNSVYKVENEILMTTFTCLILSL